MPAKSLGELRKIWEERPPPVAGVPEVVYEGRVYHRGTLISAEIGVDGAGTIVRVKRVVPGSRRVSFGDSVILPSGFDMHVHFRDPGEPGEVENLETGTLQAAIGGIGGVVDMPNTTPPITTVERVEEKIARIAAHAAVDVAPYAALVPGVQVEALGQVASGFKLFLAPTTGDLALAPGSPLTELLDRVSATGLPLHVHAEDPRRFPQGPQSPQDTDGWDRARPMEAENSAVRALEDHPRALRLQIAHVTSAAAAGLARSMGVSFEATPHHLLLKASQFGGTREKVNPPLRPERVRQGLWEEFRAGRVPVLASDHAPHALARKSLPFSEAPSGLPGVETMLPLMLARVRARQLDLPVLVNAACRRPALLLGLPRGRLEPGLEANFMVVNFRHRTPIEAARLHAPCGWTPYEGREAVFPTAHYLRGRRIVEDGEFVGGTKGRPLRVAGSRPARPVARLGIPPRGGPA